MPARQYLTRPPPDSWAPVLTGLRPENLPFPDPRPAPLGLAADLILQSLSDTQQQALWYRHGLGLHTPDIAELLGCSPQNVSKAVSRAEKFLHDPEVISSVRVADQSQRLAQLHLQSLFRSLRPFAAAQFTESTSVTLPDASPQQLWAFLCGVQRAVNPDLQSRLIPGGALVIQKRLPTPEQISAALTEHESFLMPEELAELLGISPLGLPVVTPFYPFLQRTAAGTYGVTSWPLHILITAVAEQLAMTGVADWHYSAVGMAAATFDETLRQYPHRKFLTLLTRPEHRERFTPAGQLGHWTLQVFADGHPSNSAAIYEVLAHADRPLNWTEISPNLRRSVQPGTILKILGQPQFVKTERGTYTVRGHPWLSGDPQSRPAPPAAHQRRS